MCYLPKDIHKTVCGAATGEDDDLAAIHVDKELKRASLEASKEKLLLHRDNLSFCIIQGHVVISIAGAQPSRYDPYFGHVARVRKFSRGMQDEDLLSMMSGLC